MKLQDWAALIAIIEFAGKAWRKISKRHGKPIKAFLCKCIDSVIDFLTTIRDRLEASDEQDDSNNYGVTGGSYILSFYAR